MYSVHSNIFKVNPLFDRTKRFDRISFELIKEPTRTVAPLGLGLLEKDLLELYNERGWTMPVEEITESLETASVLVTIKLDGKLCGFFCARGYSDPRWGELYYLERLIITETLHLSTVILMSTLLVFNLPGIGERELLVSSITRLKIIANLIELFGSAYFSSAQQGSPNPLCSSQVKAILKAVSAGQKLKLNERGLLKDIFNGDFTHNRDERLLASSTPLGEYDAALVLNTVPADREELFNSLSRSQIARDSILIRKIIEHLKNDQLFIEKERVY